MFISSVTNNIKRYSPQSVYSEYGQIIGYSGMSTIYDKSYLHNLLDIDVKYSCWKGGYDGLGELPAPVQWNAYSGNYFYTPYSGEIVPSPFDGIPTPIVPSTDSSYTIQRYLDPASGLNVESSVNIFFSGTTHGYGLTPEIFCGNYWSIGSLLTNLTYEELPEPTPANFIPRFNIYPGLIDTTPNSGQMILNESSWESHSHRINRNGYPDINVGLKGYNSLGIANPGYGRIIINADSTWDAANTFQIYVTDNSSNRGPTVDVKPVRILASIPSGTYIQPISNYNTEKSINQLFIDFDNGITQPSDFYLEYGVQLHSGCFIKPSLCYSSSKNKIAEFPSIYYESGWHHEVLIGYVDKPDKIDKNFDRFCLQLETSGGPNNWELHFVNLETSGLETNGNPLFVRAGSSQLREFSAKISTNIYSDDSCLELNGERWAGFISDHEDTSIFNMGFYDIEGIETESGIHVWRAKDDISSGLILGSSESNDYMPYKIHNSYDRYVSIDPSGGEGSWSNDGGFALAPHLPETLQSFSFFSRTTLTQEPNILTRLHVQDANPSWPMFVQDAHGISGVSLNSSVKSPIYTDSYSRPYMLNLFASGNYMIGAAHWWDNQGNISSFDINHSQARVEAGTSSIRIEDIRLFGHSDGTVQHVQDTKHASVHEFAIGSGNGYINPTDVDGFFKKRYQGADVFAQQLGESGHYMSLNIQEYRGNANSNSDYWLEEDFNENISHTTESGITSWFNRYIDTTGYEELVLDAVNGGFGIESAPNLRMWIDNDSQDYDGVLLRSKLYIPMSGGGRYEFIGEDKRIPNGLNLISTPFLPSQNSISSGWIVPTTSYGSGNINFCFELEEPDEDDKPVNVDIKLYSADVRFYGYLQPTGLNPTGLNLYISGEGSIQDTIPLYTVGGEAIITGIPLYISGFTEFNSNITLYLENRTNNLIPNISGVPTLPLYLFAPSELNGDDYNIPLYIKANSGTIGGGYDNPASMPLFINVNASGQIPQSAISLFIGKELEEYGFENLLPLYMPNPQGTFVGNPENGVVPSGGQFPPNLQLFLSNIIEPFVDDISLYISGDGSRQYTENIPLYLEGKGTDIVSGIPLFIPTSGLTSNLMPLFTKSLNFTNDNITLVLERDNLDLNTLPLFLLNKEDDIENIPLFIKGGQENKEITLYIAADYNQDSETLPLNIWGTTSSGLMKNTTLYVNSENFSPISLFLKADEQVNEWQIPLFMQCEFNPRNLNLFLYNNYLEEQRVARLYTKGGAPSASGSLTLYMARDSERMNKTCPLYLHSPSGILSSLNLFVDANYNEVNDVMLYISGQGISSFNNTLYTHGF